MTRVVGGANTVMYVNVNNLANEPMRGITTPPPRDILAFESLIRCVKRHSFTFVGFHAFRTTLTRPTGLLCKDYNDKLL